VLLASLAPDVWLALAGFAATGLGLASQAGLRTGLTTLSFLGLAAALIAWLSRDSPELGGSASPHPGGLCWPLARLIPEAPDARALPLHLRVR